MLVRHWHLRLIVPLLMLPLSSALLAQGSIAGRVTRSDSAAPVPGAVISVVGTRAALLVDGDGRFRIAAVPAGIYTLHTRAPGHMLAESRVSVRDGVASDVRIVLASATAELASVTVVGATAEALARIPGAATAISARQIEAQMPTSANDVLRTVPGVHIQEEEGAGLRANIGIRGLDPDRSRSVLVLEDGIPVALAPYGEPEMYYSPPIDRMARIEVIKGSGSILFGPQTIGGVVNYVTAEPVAGRGGRVEIRGGGGGQQLVKASLGGTAGAARALLSAFQRRANNVNGLDYDVRDVTGKAGVRTPVGDFSAKLSLYEEASNATYVGLTDSLFRARPFQHPAPDDRLDVRRQALTLAHVYDFAPATSLRTTIYGYHTARDWTRRDYTYGATGGTLRFANSTGARNRSFDVAGIEPRFRTLWTAAGVTSDLDAGARFHYERARDKYVLGDVNGAPTGVRDDEFRNGEALSAWVQNRVALHPTLEVTPGVRVERFSYSRHITRTRVRRSAEGSSTRLPEDIDSRNGDTVSEVIPGLGAAWRPRPLMTVYAGAHRGFAPPRTKDALIYGDPTLPPDAQVPAPVSLQLDAERSWNYEFGSRLSPRPWLSLEGTAFLLDFTNQIIEPSFSAGSAVAAALANQGATRHRGVEVGGALDVGKLLGRTIALVLDGHWTYSQATFSRDRFMADGGDTVNVRGNRLPYAPRHRAHAALTVEHPAGVRVRLDADLVGAQFTDNVETVGGSANGRVGEIPEYHTFDATVLYSVPHLSGVTLTGAVRNLTNRTYIASRRPEGIKVGLPRLVTAGLAWSF